MGHLRRPTFCICRILNLTEYYLVYYNVEYSKNSTYEQTKKFLIIFLTLIATYAIGGYYLASYCSTIPGLEPVERPLLLMLYMYPFFFLLIALGVGFWFLWDKINQLLDKRKPWTE